MAAVRTAPREFRPPIVAPPAAPRSAAIAAPPALALEIAVAPAPAEAPRSDLAIQLPKPVVTGVLSDARAAAAPATPAASLKTAGFGAAQTSGSGSPRGSVTSVGGFGQVQTAANTGAPRGRASLNGVGGAFGAASTAAEAPREKASIQSAAFGDARVADPRAAAAQKIAAPAAATPVEILSKPRPEYTAEARALRIEGDVLLEVLFTASGEARVLRVIQGLGHGLNEAAAAAARAIQFRPARRAGAAVDSTAQVRIVFQLAY